MSKFKVGDLVFFTESPSMGVGRVLENIHTNHGYLIKAEIVVGSICFKVGKVSEFVSNALTVLSPESYQAIKEQYKKNLATLDEAMAILHHDSRNVC
jgi:hypothetical protein